MKLRPEEKLRHPKEFQRAFDRRRSASDDCIIVYAVENEHPYARFGISLARKKVRKAHDRNRMKRILREVFRLEKSRIPPRVDYVIVPRGKPFEFAEMQIALPALTANAAQRLLSGSVIWRAPRAGKAKSAPKPSENRGRHGQHPHPHPTPTKPTPTPTETRKPPNDAQPPA